MDARTRTGIAAGAALVLGLAGVGVVRWVLPDDADPAPRYADASTAGVPDDVTLTPSGSLTVDKPGTVVEALDITGPLVINAADVTVRDTRVTSDAFWTVTVAGTATGVRFERVTVDGRGVDGAEGSSGIVGPGTFTDVEVTGVENGFVPGSGTVISRAYVHGLAAPGQPHYDGIQIDGGVDDVRITGSTIANEQTQTSAVMVDNYSGPATRITVTGNRLIGGGYTVYADGSFTDASIDVTYADNRLGKGSYGYAVRRNASVAWSGNVDDTTGEPVE